MWRMLPMASQCVQSGQLSRGPWRRDIEVSQPSLSHGNTPALRVMTPPKLHRLIYLSHSHFPRGNCEDGSSSSQWYSHELAHRPPEHGLTCISLGERRLYRLYCILLGPQKAWFSVNHHITPSAIYDLFPLVEGTVCFLVFHLCSPLMCNSHWI